MKKKLYFIMLCLTLSGCSSAEQGVLSSSAPESESSQPTSEYDISVETSSSEKAEELNKEFSLGNISFEIPSVTPYSQISENQLAFYPVIISDGSLIVIYSETEADTDATFNNEQCKELLQTFHDSSISASANVSDEYTSFSELGNTQVPLLNAGYFADINNKQYWHEVRYFFYNNGLYTFCLVEPKPDDTHIGLFLDRIVETVRLSKSNNKTVTASEDEFETDQWETSITNDESFSSALISALTEIGATDLSSASINSLENLSGDVMAEILLEMSDRTLIADCMYLSLTDHWIINQIYDADSNHCYYSLDGNRFFDIYDYGTDALISESQESLESIDPLKEYDKQSESISEDFDRKLESIADEYGL